MNSIIPFENIDEKKITLVSLNCLCHKIVIASICCLQQHVVLFIIGKGMESSSGWNILSDRLFSLEVGFSSRVASTAQGMVKGL